VDESRATHENDPQVRSNRLNYCQQTHGNASMIDVHQKYQTRFTNKYIIIIF